jgi:putative transposase
MTFNSEIHHRHSIRLLGYDYSRPGYYFVTLCTHDKECYFGDIENNKIVLNKMGTMVEKKWNDLPVHFPGIKLDRIAIMPNHLHGIIIIADHRRGGVVPPFGIIASHEGAMDRGATTAGAMTAPLRKRKTLGQMIAWFKYESTKEINRDITCNPEMIIWQRNFFERIVRNEDELNRIRNYIATNPETWHEDENYVCVGAGLSRP